MKSKSKEIVLNWTLILFLIASLVYFYTAVSQAIDYLFMRAAEQQIAEQECENRLLELDYKYLLYFEKIKSEHNEVEK